MVISSYVLPSIILKLPSTVQQSENGVRCEAGGGKAQSPQRTKRSLNGLNGLSGTTGSVSLVTSAAAGAAPGHKGHSHCRNGDGNPPRCL